MAKSGGAAPKKIPVRRCTSCGEHYPKIELIRVLRTPEGEIILDQSGKKSGRGAYICKKKDCLKRARRAKRLESSLQCDIPDEVYLRLEEGLSN